MERVVWEGQIPTLVDEEAVKSYQRGATSFVTPSEISVLQVNLL